MLFESQVCGPVEPGFNEDRVFGTEPDGLTVGDLKELVAATKGKIVGQNSFDTDGEDFVEPV